MDKYQRVLIERGFFYVEDEQLQIKTKRELKKDAFTSLTSQKLNSRRDFSRLNRNFGCFDFETDTLRITQDEDIHANEYETEICLYTASDPIRFRFGGGVGRSRYISRISVTRDGKNWEKLPVTDFSDGKEEYGCKLVLDFSSRIKAVKFSFINNLADDYIMNVEYVEADKDKYYGRIAEEKARELVKAADVKVSEGENLVNIFFKPCCKECKSTEVSLYFGAIDDNRFMGDYKAKEGRAFININNLSFGSYTFILRQTDINGKPLMQTDPIKFVLSPPRSVNRNCLPSC